MNDSGQDYLASRRVDFIVNQITIRTNTPSSASNAEKRSKLEYVESQKNNRYSSSKCSPYLVHIKSLDDNRKLTSYEKTLEKTLADIFPAISNIKRRGRNLIIINFKFSFDANQFIQSNILPKNWIAYIPNYKIFRSGIVRGVDMTCRHPSRTCHWRRYKGADLWIGLLIPDPLRD